MPKAQSAIRAIPRRDLLLYTCMIIALVILSLINAVQKVLGGSLFFLIYIPVAHIINRIRPGTVKTRIPASVITIVVIINSLWYLERSQLSASLSIGACIFAAGLFCFFLFFALIRNAQHVTSETEPRFRKLRRISSERFIYMILGFCYILSIGMALFALNRHRHSVGLSFANTTLAILAVSVLTYTVSIWRVGRSIESDGVVCSEDGVIEINGRELIALYLAVLSGFAIEITRGAWILYALSCTLILLAHCLMSRMNELASIYLAHDRGMICEKPFYRLSNIAAIVIFFVVSAILAIVGIVFYGVMRANQ
jgi:hypothetical protein